MYIYTVGVTLHHSLLHARALRHYCHHHHHYRHLPCVKALPHATLLCDNSGVDGRAEAGEGCGQSNLPTVAAECLLLFPC